MGDTFQQIVVPSARLEDAPRLAETVVKFLIESGIVSPERTDCTLGEHGGHPPGVHFDQAVGGESRDVRGLRTNGMAVVIGREVFHNGGLGVDGVRCPLCGVNQVESDWGEAINRWSDGDDDALLMCNACYADSPLTLWVFEPAWGFACLGFTFWNWPPLKPEFVQQVSGILRHEVLLVYGKL